MGINIIKNSESSGSSSPPSPPYKSASASNKAIRLTSEQQKIIDSTAKLLLVSAFAGTGKTSTLIEYAKAHPDKSMTYLAFNKSVKEEAQARFPRNVLCVTAHGLAYSEFGSQYKDKLGNVKAFHISKCLKQLNSMQANLVLSAINRFLQSDDTTILPEHLKEADGKLMPAATASVYIKYANDIWKVMQRVGDNTIPMPHDGYLKLYQLAGRTIGTDVILFDEAQDASSIMLAMVDASDAIKVFVGDENQSIYAFRGAVNAMEDMQPDEHLFLSTSFRFGSGIATLANAVLNTFKDVPNKLKGSGKTETKFSVNTFRPHTRITRTNAQLFQEAISAVEAERKFGFVGGIEGYGFDSLICANNLRLGKTFNVKDAVIKRFGTFEEMKQYAEDVDDKELKVKIKIVTEYSGRVESLVASIKAAAVLEGDADIILTTAHKSKGLEWHSVYLADDFTDMLSHIDEDGQPVTPQKEEVNLLYVALTRAETCLSLPETLNEWLDGAGLGHISSRRYTTIPRLKPFVDAVENEAEQEAEMSLMINKEFKRCIKEATSHEDYHTR